MLIYERKSVFLFLLMELQKNLQLSFQLQLHEFSILQSKLQLQLHKFSILNSNSNSNSMELELELEFGVQCSSLLNLLKISSMHE